MNTQEDAPKSSIELGDIFRQHAPAYFENHTLSPGQYKVMHAIMNCRTAALGGHVMACDHCHEIHISYNSCRNRHCPKCQSLRTANWLENRRKELLSVDYFHVVFTLPHELNNLISYNKVAMYNLLFQSAWETIKKLGEDKERLNGLMGMMAILHTWSQTLLSHNHLHCIVPGGALDKSKEHWNKSKNGYLFPVKVMGKMFRGIFISKMRTLIDNKELTFPDAQNTDRLLDALMEKSWVVYSKKPFAGPEKLLDYLGRYTHKIAISNYRILSCDDKIVRFKWRDYSDDNKEKVMELAPDEFIRRILSHVVPTGFMRIRTFGFLANACKTKNIEIIRDLLSYNPDPPKSKDTETLMLETTGVDITLCPHCKIGKLHKIQTLQSKIGKGLNDTS